MIVEKKRDLDVIFGFLVIVVGLAAVRGAEKAPIAAAVMSVLAVALLVAWILIRARTGRLTITGDEIAYGRIDRPPAQRIVRAETSLLRFRQGRVGLRPTGWFLEPVGGPTGPGILMLGFDMAEVQRACVEHGWSFA